MILLTGGVPAPGGSDPGVGRGDGSVWSRGVSGPGGVSGPRGCLVLGGVWSWGGLAQGVPAPRGCLMETPPRMATATGGTHPAGMYSCL